MTAWRPSVRLAPQAPSLKSAIFTVDDLAQSHLTLNEALLTFSLKPTPESTAKLVIAAFVNFMMEVVTGLADDVHMAEHDEILELLGGLTLGSDGAYPDSDVARVVTTVTKHEAGERKLFKHSVEARRAAPAYRAAPAAHAAAALAPRLMADRHPAQLA